MKKLTLYSVAAILSLALTGVALFAAGWVIALGFGASGVTLC